MIAGGDGPGGAECLADRPVLLEGGRAEDGGGVGAGQLVDVVDGAVAGDRTFEGGAGGWVVVAVVLEDARLGQF